MMTARKSIPLAIALCAAVAVLVLSSCATQGPVSVQGLTPAEIFQRAQDATDQGNFTRAMQYYTLFLQAYPDDKEHGVWAHYEMAFLYLKMKQNTKALASFNDVLALYATPDETLPPAPRVLAEKLKAQIEQTLKKKP
jgi:outer membrane protein assembly factor BamD (BamD/ComL family)